MPLVPVGLPRLSPTPLKRPHENHTGGGPVPLSLQKPSSANGNGSIPMSVSATGAGPTSSMSMVSNPGTSVTTMAGSLSESPKKKFKLAADESFAPPDSPGSEGEMVIDESE